MFSKKCRHTDFMLNFAAVGSLLISMPVSAEQFSLIALPDTQFYSRYRADTQYLNYENPYLTQAKWIVNNAASRNIAFTMHLGDVVDQAWVAEEWQFADQVHTVLDNANINYGVARGNHDVITQSAADTPPAPFTDYFGPSRFQGMPTYRGSDADGVNSYHTFQAGGREFLVLFTDWRNDSDSLDWAQGILDANAEKPTILISHEILAMNFANPAEPITSPHGELIWDELIKDNDQVFMTLSGHNQGTAWHTRQNSYDRDVLQMLVDFQFSPFNGAGYLRELVFDTEAETISATTFSPWIEQVEGAGITIPPFFNLPQEMTTPEAKFVYTLDFDDRFTPVPEPTSLSLLAAGAIALIRRRR